MNHAFICDAIRTPFGRYGGALSSVRTDDLGAIPLTALMARNPQVDSGPLTDVIFGSAHQAGRRNATRAGSGSLLGGPPVGGSGGRGRCRGCRCMEGGWWRASRSRGGLGDTGGG